MFKGKVHLYKNVDGKEEEIKKEFNNEKDFDTFVDKNPDLKKLRDFKWEPVKWPSLSGFGDFFGEMKTLGKTDFLKDMDKDFQKMEKEMKTIFDKGRKLLK